MDINKFEPGRVPNPGKPTPAVDLTRSNRKGLEQAKRQIEGSRELRAQEQADRIDLSPKARAMASTSPADEARAARIAELKSEFQQGSFNTPDRIAKAADQMLTGQ